jgi:hypothetical protein
MPNRRSSAETLADGWKPAGGMAAAPPAREKVRLVHDQSVFDGVIRLQNLRGNERGGARRVEDDEMKVGSREPLHRLLDPERLNPARRGVEARRVHKAKAVRADGDALLDEVARRPWLGADDRALACRRSCSAASSCPHSARPR